MKRKWRLAVMAVVLAAAVCASVEGFAAGLLKAIGSNDPIYIKAHNVSVVINNGFARTEVDQVFINDGDVDLDAVYSFPLPKQASLSELSLWINGNEVIGEVLEKQEARNVYEQEKARGNDSALAEQDDYRTFNINVTPVRAHKETRVQLVYYQPLSIDLNVGRYVYPLSEGGVDDERITFWDVDDNVQGSFSFNLEFKSAFPVKDVRMPNYEDNAVITKKTTAQQESSGEVYSINLSYPEGASLSKDVVFYWRLSDSVPARVEIVPYRADANSDGTCMVVITPAASLKRIDEGTDWIFVLDKSGSMSGNKIATLAGGVSRVIGKLSPNDRFRIVAFNECAYDLTKGYITATPENVQNWINRVQSIRADGSTNMFAGLDMAYKGLDDARTTGLILVTDGVANTGPTEYNDFLQLIAQNDMRLFTFVIGNSANTPLLEKMAKQSGGFTMNISENDDITGRLLQAKAKVLYECMHDVELNFKGERISSLTPKKLNSLYMGQQLVVFGKYKGEGEIEIELKAKISGIENTWTCTADLPKTDTHNPEIERLWALSSIEDIMEEIRDMGEITERRDEVVRLGIEYSLVTNYTSMVVVSDEEMENLGIERRNSNRVQRERQAQKIRAVNPVQSYKVETSSARNMFGGASSPGIGTGPMGPLSIGIAFWLARRRKRNK